VVVRLVPLLPAAVADADLLHHLDHLLAEKSKPNMSENKWTAAGSDPGSQNKTRFRNFPSQI
jgi:hypothetical protein